MLGLELLLAWQLTTSPDAFKEAQLLRGGWEICTRLQSANYASLSDSADVLADAALSKCADQELAFKAFLARVKVTEGGRGFDDEHQVSILGEQRRRLRDIAISTILDTRLIALRQKK
ncbi:MAG: hypothetical protein V4444_08430 [Pseudomonadota bacterium]